MCTEPERRASPIPQADQCLSYSPPASAAMPNTLRVSTMSNRPSPSAPRPPPPAPTSTASAAGAASAPPAAAAAITDADAASSPASCRTCRHWASATPRSLPSLTLLPIHQSKLHLTTTDHEKTSINVKIFEN